MSGPGPAPATFYRPAEVARMLRCSEWWVKEQARRRRIPYSWIGGSYLFTEEHIADIVRLFEVRPTGTAGSERVVARTARRNAEPADEPAIRLSARVPRRARAAKTDAAA
jgi:hypothetical protein